MTGKELIEWIKDKKAEDLQIEVQYRDDGGIYYGRDIYIVPSIEKSEYREDKEVIVL
ncbi:MAG: hypothetical protein J6Y02_17960 [Pseudobutyrivibrio sp.]|nr:hypothetical protein [Pseudobutyrivibrio sp.]